MVNAGMMMEINLMVGYWFRKATKIESCQAENFVLK